MNKKLINILSVGAVTILTASSMLPVHALSNNTHQANKTCKKVILDMKYPSFQKKTILLSLSNLILLFIFR